MSKESKDARERTRAARAALAGGHFEIGPATPPAWTITWLPRHACDQASSAGGFGTEIRAASMRSSYSPTCISS